MKYIESIKQAIMGLYNRQDTGGQIIYRNEIGFNAFDANSGKILASKIMSNQELSNEQIAKADKMLRKYKRQLESMGIEIPVMPEEYSKFLSGTIERTGNNHIKIVFDYDKNIVSTVRLIAGVQYNPVDHSWLISNITPKAIEDIKRFSQENNFEIQEDVVKLFEDLQTKKLEIKNENRIDTRLNTFKGITSTVLSIYFPYNAILVSAVKEIPKVSFGQDDRGNRCWTIYKLDSEIVNKLRTFVINNYFDVSDSAKTFIKNWIEIENKKEELKKENSIASSATDANIEIKNLGGELKPFQKAGVAYALKNKRCFIADEMGLGKTVQALATVQAANAYPSLIICPASLKYNWQREATKWNIGKSSSILSDGTIGNENKDIIIINYDILEKRKDELDKIPFKSIIFDESQYCKNYKAKRTKAAQELSKTAEYRLALTGTPILNRPQELLSQLQILGRIDDMGGFWFFAKRYCEAQPTRYGWDMSGAANLEELNTKLREHCYIRRNKKDVMKEIPPIQRVIVSLDLSNKKEYEKVEKDLAEWLKKKVDADQEFQASLIGLSDEERKKHIDKRVSDGTQKALNAEQLTKIEATKQMSAKGKMKAFKEWIDDFTESGEKLVIFADHQDIVNELANEFNCDKINGEVSAEDRQKAVDKFQNDPNAKLIVLNIKAGGVGLTLTAASNVAFIEQGWNPAAHDQAEARCYGRINDPHAVTAWYFNGKDTIDDDIYNLIQEKRDVVSRLTTGQGDDSNENTIMKGLTDIIMRKNLVETKQPKVNLEFKEPKESVKHTRVKRTTKAKSQYVPATVKAIY